MFGVGLKTKEAQRVFLVTTHPERSGQDADKPGKSFVGEEVSVGQVDNEPVDRDLEVVVEDEQRDTVPSKTEEGRTEQSENASASSESQAAASSDEDKAAS